MKTVVMLTFKNMQILDVVGPMQILAAVNSERPSPAYALTLLAEKKGPITSSGGLRLDADGAYADLPTKIDTLMIAGGEIRAALADPAMMQAVRDGAKRARRVVSICTGAFFLASAGLLNGKRATTHWRSVKLLARLFPHVTVEPDALYVNDGKIWTSAGVTAGMDLALALVREDWGDDMALAIARRHVMFVMRPGGQSQFSAHLTAQSRPKGKLASLLRWIPEHVAGPLDVGTLAARAAMSERSFARLFRKETGETPAAYVARARLDAARRLLTASDLPVQTIAADSGFGSEERMRRAFQRHLKVAPSSFRARFAQKEISP
ncbi:MAG TPA: helix-turn-helix domain-containing protein [Rhizomicrobium sp.]|jgi:transcriptional regulator GlxA family with amidase domain